jgi:hypothetical protein
VFRMAIVLDIFGFYSKKVAINSDSIPKKLI